MWIKKHEFTNDELLLLQDTTLSATELSKMLSLRVGSIRGKRKELGIASAVGSKPGKSKPERIKNEVRICLNDKCLKEFVVKPAHTKKFCCKSCSTTVNHPAPKGRGSRPYMVKSTTPAYKKYSRLVHSLSHETYLKNIELINPNGYPRTLCGVEGGWQLDHIKTIKECFENNVPAAEAASLENLRMLPWKTNLMRNFT